VPAAVQANNGTEVRCAEGSAIWRLVTFCHCHFARDHRHRAMYIGKAFNDCGIIETWDANDLVMRRREITTPAFG
jgi:hypothetical protein